MNLADRTEIEFLFPTPNLKKKKSIQKMLVKLSAGLNVFFFFVCYEEPKQTNKTMQTAIEFVGNETTFEP